MDSETCQQVGRHLERALRWMAAIINHSTRVDEFCLGLDRKHQFIKLDPLVQLVVHRRGRE